MPLASNALTTISTAESYLGLTAGAQDTVLTLLINGVSDAIETYCWRKFAKQVHVEKYAGQDRQKLYLNEWPILEQSTYPTVTVDDAAYTSGASGDYLIFTGSTEGENYLFCEGTWPATVYYRSAGTLSDAGLTLTTGERDVRKEKKNISATYLAGYVLPQFASHVSTTTSIAAGSSKTITLADTTCLAVGDSVTLSSTGAAGPPIVAAASETCTISAIPSSTTVTLTTVANAHAGTITLASTRTLPYDLEEAALALIGLKWLQRTNRGIVSESTPGGYKVQYGIEGVVPQGKIFPDDVKATLDRYQRASV